MKGDLGTALWLLAAALSLLTLALVHPGTRQASSPGQLVDVVALDRGEAALAYQRQLALATAKGRIRWRAPSPRYPSPRAGQAPHQRLPYIAADADRIYMRGRGDRGPVLAAFSRDEGAELWRREPLADTPDEVGLGFEHDRVSRALAGSAVVDAYHYEAVEGDTWFLLAATERRSGETLWRAKLGPESPGPMWVRDERIVFAAQGVTQVFRASDGAPTNLIEGATPVCVLAEELVYADAKNTAVSKLDGTESALIPVAEAFEASPPEIELRACGRYREAYVIAAEHEERLHLLSLAGPLPEHDGGFALRWHIDLGAETLPPPGRFDDIGSRYPDRRPLSGELAPFVALKLGRDEIAVVDVEEGELAWRTALEGRDRFAIYAHGGDFLIYDPEGDILARVSGQSGRIAAATRLESSFSPYHLATDELWTRHEKRWAVLDAHALEPRSNDPPAWVHAMDPEEAADELALPEEALPD